MSLLHQGFLLVDQRSLKRPPVEMPLKMAKPGGCVCVEGGKGGDVERGGERQWERGGLGQKGKETVGKREEDRGQERARARECE